jgi:hypothetical protein
MYREMPLVGWVGKAVLNHWTLRQAWKVQRACKGARSRRRGMHAGRRSVGAGRGRRAAWRRRRRSVGVDRECAEERWSAGV